MRARGFLPPAAATPAATGASAGDPGGEPRWARGVEGQRRADLGDGTFLNPILSGDHPDPSVLKDGDDYYMTFSSFDAYPGLVVWHSRDLVNWPPIGPALRKNVGAVWAPDLVKHGGRYLHLLSRRRAVPIELRGVGRRHSRAVERPHRPEDRPHRSRTRRRSRRPPLPVPERGVPRDAGARRVVDGRRAGEGLRRLADPGVVRHRRVRAGGPEDPAARRLLLHGAGAGRHGRAAHRPHDRRRTIAVDRRAVGAARHTTRSCGRDRRPSRGGQGATARWWRMPPAAGGWSTTPTRTTS